MKCERTETKALHDNRANRNFRNNPKFIWRLAALFALSFTCASIASPTGKIILAIVFLSISISYLAFANDDSMREIFFEMEDSYEKCSVEYVDCERVKEMRNVSYS